MNAAADGETPVKGQVVQCPRFSLRVIEWIDDQSRFGIRLQPQKQHPHAPPPTSTSTTPVHTQGLGESLSQPLPMLSFLLFPDPHLSISPLLPTSPHLLLHLPPSSPPTHLPLQSLVGVVLFEVVSFFLFTTYRQQHRVLLPRPAPLL